MLSTKFRLGAGVTLLILAELLLFGAAEGPQKWQWILWGSVPDVALTIGFVVL